METNYEYLKPVLGDELYGQFTEKMSSAEGIVLINNADGTHIPKAKFDEERNASKAYKAQIDELNQKLGQLQKDAEGNEALKTQIAQLQSDIASKDTEMKQQRLQFTIRDAIRDSKARNVDVVMKMIDMSKIAENNGQIIGLNEQIEALRKNDSYLFVNDNDQNGGVDPHSQPDGNKIGTNYSVNELIRRAAGR